MKLIDSLKEKGNPYWIPDCSRGDLPSFFKELGFKKGVEVGVFMGNNLMGFCEEGFEIYGVDPYLEEHRNTIRKNRSDTMQEIYDMVSAETKPYPKCKIIRKTSAEAVKDFEDRSLDFVYIDADHTFGHVAMDLMLWAPKVRKYGIISGHDYFVDTQGARMNRRLRFPRFAVDAFAKAYDFDNWYVVGRKEHVAGEVRDRSLSFFFIKHW